MMIKIHRQATATPKISATIQSAKSLHLFSAPIFLSFINNAPWSDQEKS